jgi:NAD(P)-dependent dehydrogenase (short-subunit alcohol dehydrogenase family)
MMDLGLHDKVVLVTGSTAGIGFAAATQFAREGAEVIVHGRSLARVETAMELLREHVPNARLRAAAGDLATAEGAAAVIASAPMVDVLVNNVGIFEATAFEDITDSDWTRFFETNVMSGVRMARHYLPAMLTRGWGRIQFISSESGIMTPAEMVHYGLTKTAQLALVQGLAARTTGTGVTVNAILPGPTRTEGVTTYLEGLAESLGMSVEQTERDFFAKTRPTSLLQRFAEPEEIASMIVYSASARATATNAAGLRVDGGIIRGLI